MVDKEDCYLIIKINHNDESKEYKFENLPSLNELKSEIMGYFSIPDFKKYMHLSFKNKEGQKNFIEKAVDLMEYSNSNQGDNNSYIELDLSIDNELNKIKQFMISNQFNSNNNNKINSENYYQNLNLNEKVKKNESKEKNNEEIKKLKIEELQNQINETKKRREQKKKIKEMNNKIFQNFENISKMKKELDDLKISYFINEIKKKNINDIEKNINDIEKNVSEYLRKKSKKFDECITSIKYIINQLEQNIKSSQNNKNIIIDLFTKQNDVKISELKDNFKRIKKDLDKIKNEINNISINKANNDSNELQINNKEEDNKQQPLNINNENIIIHESIKRKGNKKYITINRRVKSDLSSINNEKKSNSDEIIGEFNLLLEQIFSNDLSDITNKEEIQLKNCFYKLKSLKLEPLTILEQFYNKNILVIRANDIQKKVYNKKYRKIKIRINNLESKYNNEENIKLNKEPKKYFYQRSKIKKDN